MKREKRYVLINQDGFFNQRERNAYRCSSSVQHTPPSLCVLLRHQLPPLQVTTSKQDLWCTYTPTSTASYTSPISSRWVDDIEKSRKKKYLLLFSSSAVFFPQNAFFTPRAPSPESKLATGDEHSTTKYLKTSRKACCCFE